MARDIGSVAWPVVYQVANHILKSGALDITVRPDQLAARVTEITVETSITGASLLVVQLADPYWTVQRSGIMQTDSSGELTNSIDVEFPEGSQIWWRLAMVDGGNDISQPNVTLTFIDRIISYLQQDWGPLAVKAGTRTRAQFVAQLVGRIPRAINDYGVIGEGKNKIDFVCPQENIVQPVAPSSNSSSAAGSTVGGVTVMSSARTAHKSARKNKTHGIAMGAALTVKGSRANARQVHIANLLLGVGEGLHAPSLALEACMFDAIFESSMGVSNGWDASNPTYGGPLGGNTGYFSTYGSASSDSVAEQMATSFFQGGRGFQGGGAIALSRSSSDVAYIGSQVTAATPFDSQGYSTQYLSQGFPFSSAVAEAKAFVAAYGSAPTISIDTGTTGRTTPTKSDVSQLQRGTTSNPDEDSWSCIQRLASAVNWNAWSNGDTLYYMDGPAIIAQKPALYLRLAENGVTWSAVDPLTGKTTVETTGGNPIVTQLTYTFDDTAYLYESTHKRKGRVQHRTAIRKPQTAARVQFNLVCGVFEFRCGDVIVFQDAGPINGRWIVEDTTRNVFADLFTQITLGPATVPYPEPQYSSSSSQSASGATAGPGSGSTAASPGATAGKPGVGNGNASGAAQVAQKALARQQSQHCFHYPPGDVRPAGGIQYDLLTASPVIDDCSGFVIACYKLAGLPDPSGNGYDHAGYTGDMVTNCTRVTIGDAQPGDMVFYGPPPCLHVTIYIGSGQVISMGTEGDPAQGRWDQMGPCAPYGVFRSNFIKATPSTTGGLPNALNPTLTSG